MKKTIIKKQYFLFRIIRKFILLQHLQFRLLFSFLSLFNIFQPFYKISFSLPKIFKYKIFYISYILYVIMERKKENIYGKY